MISNFDQIGTQVSQSCDNNGLTISTKEREVVNQPAPGKPFNEPTITVNGQKLKVDDKFTYLGPGKHSLQSSAY